MNLQDKKNLFYPVIFVLLVILFGFGILKFFDNNITPFSTKIDDFIIDPSIALQLKDLKQVSKKDGSTDWELKAASASLFRAESLAMLETVAVIFFTNEGKKIFLNSDRGLLDTLNHDIELIGNVQVSYDTLSLFTEKLHYDKKRHIIYSTTEVRLESSTSMIEAETMQIELQYGKFIFSGKVKGIFSEYSKRP